MRKSGIVSIATSLAAYAALGFAQMPPECHGPADIDRALTTQPSAGAYNALGAWLAERNQEACAIAAFRNAVRLNPNAVEGHFNLGLALQQRDLGQSVRELETAAKLDPSRAQVHLVLGRLLQESGQLPAAET